MIVDRYTKTILTVIAVCLVWLCVGNARFGAPLEAQQPREPQRVVIVGWTAPEAVTIQAPGQTGGGLPVVISGWNSKDPLRVAIAGSDPGPFHAVERDVPVRLAAGLAVPTVLVGTGYRNGQAAFTTPIPVDVQKPTPSRLPGQP
jgi:hypothetical protein